MNHQEFLDAIQATIGQPPLPGTPRWSLDFPHGGRMNVLPHEDPPSVSLTLAEWPAEAFPDGANGYTGAWNIVPSRRDDDGPESRRQWAVKELARRLALAGYVPPVRVVGKKGDPYAALVGSLLADPPPPGLLPAMPDNQLIDQLVTAHHDGYEVVFIPQGLALQVHTLKHYPEIQAHGAPDLPASFAFEFEGKKTAFDSPTPEEAITLAVAAYPDAKWYCGGRGYGEKMALKEAAANPILTIYNALPDDVKRKVSLHDLKRIHDALQPAAGLTEQDPPMVDVRVDVNDGKYTVIFNANPYRFEALRHGEPWNRNLVGDNLVYWLAVELDEARKQLAGQPAAVPPMSEGDEDDHPLWCVDAQIRGLMEGIGATEDLEAVKDFLRATGLRESTATRMRDALCAAEAGPPELPNTCCPECAHDCYGEKPNRHCLECGWKENLHPDA